MAHPECHCGCAGSGRSSREFEVCLVQQLEVRVVGAADRVLFVRAGQLENCAGSRESLRPRKIASNLTVTLGAGGFSRYMSV